MKKRPSIKDNSEWKFGMAMLVLLVAIVVICNSIIHTANPPVSEVKRYWAYAEEYVIDGTGLTDMTTQMRTLFSAARNIQLQPGKTYKITDSLVIPESTTVWLNGANILASLSSAKYGVVVRKSGVKIYGPGAIVTTGSMARPNGTYGSAVMVGYWPMTNPVVPVDGFEMRDVTLRTAFPDAYALGIFGLVRNPKISQVKLVSASDACAGLIAAEWAYGYDSTKTYHPQGVVLDQWTCPDKVDDSDVANVVYFSGVDGFRIANGIIKHTGNNGVSIVAGELGFSLADTLYHRKADTLFSSAGIVENVQIRSAHNDGFNIEGKSGTTTNRYYPRLTFIGCTVDTSNNAGSHAGFRVNNAYGVKFINCRASNHQFGAYVTGTSRNIGFDGCLFFKNRSSGIYIGNDTALYGTTIVNSVFENNGTADYTAGVRVGKAFSTFVGPGNTFGLSADESQTYAVDKDSAAGNLYLHGNFVRGYKSGGAGFNIDTNTYAYGNEVAAGLTKYSGTGRGLDMGQYRAPWPKGAANYVFKMDPAGDTAGWFVDATAAAASGDDQWYVDSSGAAQDLSSPDTMFGSAYIYLKSLGTNSYGIYAKGLLPLAGGTMTGNLNLGTNEINDVGLIDGEVFSPQKLWPTGQHLDVLGSYIAVPQDTVYAGHIEGDSVKGDIGVFGNQRIIGDTSIASEGELHDSLVTRAVHEHDNLTGDTNSFYNIDSTHEAQIYWDTTTDTGTVDRGWTLDLGDGMTTIDSLLAWVYQWGRKGSTIRIDSARADSIVTGKGRFGKRDSTLVMTDAYVVYNNVTGKALKLCPSTNVDITVQDSGSYYKVLFSATGGGSGLVYTTEKDSGAWSVFEPLSPNTGIKLSGSLQVGDSGITYITDPFFGHSQGGQYSFPTTQGSVGQILKLSTNDSTLEWAADAGTGSGTADSTYFAVGANQYHSIGKKVVVAAGTGISFTRYDAGDYDSIVITNTGSSSTNADTLGHELYVAGTKLELGSVVEIGDSGLTYVTDPWFGYGPGGHYTFPTSQGSVGQVLKLSTVDSVLEWADDETTAGGSMDSNDVMAVIRDTTYVDSGLVGQVVHDTGATLYAGLTHTHTYGDFYSVFSTVYFDDSVVSSDTLIILKSGSIDGAKLVTALKDSITAGQTAYGWGNHASAGYAAGTTTITAGTALTGGGSLASNRTIDWAGMWGFASNDDSAWADSTELDDVFAKLSYANTYVNGKVVKNSPSAGWMLYWGVDSTYWAAAPAGGDYHWHWTDSSGGHSIGQVDNADSLGNIVYISGTTLKLGTVTNIGDSGVTHITDLKLGINDGTDKTWLMPTTKGTAGQVRKMNTGATAEEWTSDDDVPDNNDIDIDYVSGDATDDNRLDSSVCAPVVHKAEKDASGNTITSTYATQATTITAGTALTGGGSLASNRTIDWTGGWGFNSNADSAWCDSTELDDVFAKSASPIFTGKITADSIAGDSAQFTELDVTNARIATAFSIGGKKLTGNQHFRLNISNPSAVYTNDAEICIVPVTEAALTITSYSVTLDADPTTEIEFSLKFADAFIGMANATVIDDSATVAGVTSVTSGFGDATVPAGKCIYLLFDAAPAAAIKQMCLDITYDFD